MCWDARHTASPAGSPQLPRVSETPCRQYLPMGFWGAACIPQGFVVAAVPLSLVPERVHTLPRGSQGWGSSLHPRAACVGVCVVGRRGWTPPVSQLGELNQEIPAGLTGSWLSHFTALSKCPCRGCGAPAPLRGDRGCPHMSWQCPWPWPRVTPSPTTPVPRFPPNVFLGLDETESSWDADMPHIPAWELALRGQGEGRQVGVGTVGLSSGARWEENDIPKAGFGILLLLKGVCSLGVLGGGWH